MINMNNPILPGFNPDPSICRVGDNYYIATSTFEWFPGVQIHHSKDLVNWELVKRPLKRTSQLDMIGNNDSCGVWAPCLTYSNNKFWLVYTDVKQTNGCYKDTPNYIVTCDRIDGEWSDPVYINSSGFDPSLFHDDDGKKYFLNMVYDHRFKDDRRFYGICIQEIEGESLSLIGKPTLLTKGTNIGKSEGPHIFKHNEYYYLVLAEGGTSYDHCVSIMRSKQVLGPYEGHPENPILTSDNENSTLQKAGHGDIFETYDGNWYMVHLCSQPIFDKEISDLVDRYCPLGRETAIQEIYWENNWPYVLEGRDPSNNIMSLQNIKKIVSKDIFEHFDEQLWNNCFQTLRGSLSPKYYSLTERKSHLRLYGNQSLSSRFEKSMIAKRWESLNFNVEIKVDFNPSSFQQSAGIVNYYNCDNFTACGITYDEELGKCIEVFEVNNSEYNLYEKLSINAFDEVTINSIVNGKKYNYEIVIEAKVVLKTKQFHSGKLSDDYIGLRTNANFTGAFVGIYCYDMTGQKTFADFDYFKYIES